MNQQLKTIQDKIVDYTRFAMVLLAVSVFMFIGVIVPSEGKQEIQTYTMMVSTIIFLAAALFFFQKVIGYKRQLAEMEDGQ
ncbi:YrhC family protein [Bacillus salitolerans]|uniref:YrhC family protein n=1 Tax=Bacillus salitolerans TaxID=1437434 RepID=A0ABW4LND5_9BACI